MKTELSHFKVQDLRDTPGWPPQDVTVVTVTLPEAGKLFHFPLRSPSYTTLFQTPFSHCISQKQLLFHRIIYIGTDATIKALGTTGSEYLPDQAAYR